MICPVVIEITYRQDVDPVHALTQSLTQSLTHSLIHTHGNNYIISSRLTPGGDNDDNHNGFMSTVKTLVSLSCAELLGKLC